MQRFFPYLQLTAAIIGMSLAAPALAEDKPAVSVSLVSFFNYHYVLAAPEGAAGDNAFSLERAYLNIEPKIDDHWSGRLTPDLSAPKVAGESYKLRLKFSYIEGKKLMDSGLNVRAGMIPTPFAEPLDKAWGYRVLAKSPLDANKVVASADLGVSLGFDWEGGGAKLMVLNGEGYESPESTKGKDLALSVNHEVIDGLVIHTTADYGTRLGGQSQFWEPDVLTYDSRLVAALLATFDHDLLRAGAEVAFIHAKVKAVDDAREALSLSAYVVGKVNEKIEVPVRFVRFDPNSDAKTGKDDEVQSVIAGVSYTFAGKMKLIPNVHYEKAGKDDAVITGFMHLEAKL